MRKQNNHSNEKRLTTTRSIGLFCLALGLAVLWTGCNQEAKVTADTSPVGSYTLVSVDGKPVPCTVKHEGKEGPTVKSGTFIINTDGTCSSKIAFTMPDGGDGGREVKATYTREGSKLTMKWEGAGLTVGTIEGDSFTMNNEGMILAYRK